MEMRSVPPDRPEPSRGAGWWRMSGAGRGGQASVLDPHRLSVRANDGAQPNGPKTGDSDGPWVDIRDVAMSEDTAFRAVEEGDTRPIHTVGDAMDRLDEYAALRDGQMLTLERTDGSDTEVLNIPYSHRWTPEYRKMTYSKLKSAEEYLIKRWGDPVPTTMLTLTVGQTDSDGNALPWEVVLNRLLDSWDTFRKALDRAMPDFIDYEYLRMVEPHKSGYPHIHVAIFGAALPGLESVVEKLWVGKYGAGESWAQSVDAKTGRSAQQLESPAAYVMKYLSKTTVRKDGEHHDDGPFKAFAAGLWVTGKRQLSMSEGLSEAAASDYESEETDEKWRFVGISDGLRAGKFGGKTAEAILDRMQSDRFVPLPSEAVKTVIDGKIG